MLHQNIIFNNSGAHEECIKLSLYKRCCRIIALYVNLFLYCVRLIRMILLMFLSLNKLLNVAKMYLARRLQ